MAVQRYELEALSSDVFRLTVSEGTDGAAGGRDVWLTLGRPLDRELQSSYALTITAYDGGTPPKSGSVDIQVLLAVKIRGVDPYGTGGTRPPIFGLGDIITNAPSIFLE